MPSHSGPYDRLEELGEKELRCTQGSDHLRNDTQNPNEAHSNANCCIY